MRHYSFDPGIVTGVAVSDEEGICQQVDQFTLEKLYEFLKGIDDAAVFVVENFRIRPEKAQSFSWDGMKVIRIIGAIEFAAYKLGCEYILQEPSVKPIGYKWAGLSVPKDHSMSHQTDAWAHLVYYNHKVKGLQIPIMRRGELK